MMCLLFPVHTHPGCDPIGWLYGGGGGRGITEVCNTTHSRPFQVVEGSQKFAIRLTHDHFIGTSNTVN